MAGLLCQANSGEIALAAATAKTILQIKAPANQRVLIRTVRLFGKQPAGGTGTPIKVRMTRSTANFGTATGAATVGKRNPSNGETVQSTTGQNFTVEPTAPTDSGLMWELPDQSGILEPDLGSPIEIPGGQSVQFEMTSTGTPTVAAVVDFEE